MDARQRGGPLGAEHGHGAARARDLFEARQARLNMTTTRRRRASRHDQTYDAREDAIATSPEKQSTIADAIARARARRASRENE